MIAVGGANGACKQCRADSQTRGAVSELDNEGGKWLPGARVVVRSPQQPSPKRGRHARGGAAGQLLQHLESFFVDTVGVEPFGEDSAECRVAELSDQPTGLAGAL